MNIPNNYTNKDAELYRSAIINEFKDRIVEHRVLTITKDLEETEKLAEFIAEAHDVIMFQEKMRPVRPVGSCHFPMHIEYN